MYEPEIASSIGDIVDHKAPMGVKEHLGGFQEKKKQGNIRGDPTPKDNEDTEAGDDDDGTDDDGTTEKLHGNAGGEKTDAPDGNDDTEPPKKEDLKPLGHTEQTNKKDLNPIVINKKGTGPTDVGYVKDFIEERKSPAYRNLQTPVTDLSPTVAKLVNENSVIPCEDESTGSINSRCLDHDTPLIAYNSQPFLRTWCGQEIKPKSAVVMTEHCTDPVAHLFAHEIPPVSGELMPPIIIKSSAEKEVQEENLQNIECNIPCQQEEGLDLSGNKKRDIFIDGETWKITIAKGNWGIDRTEYMRDHYFSTESLLSNVPLSNFDSKIHSLRNRPMVDFDTAKEKAIYLVNDNCSASRTKRNRWFDAVKKALPVDSYGKCGHNIEVPQGMTISTPEGRVDLSKKYRFVLAFDDSNEKDHISDVVWEAFASGAVPVVSGADNIHDRFPPKSFISVSKFQQWDDLGDYLKKVNSDKELWQSYHKWREDEEAVSAFERQYQFTRTGSSCRLCRWAYAKKYGLGWDHQKQEVRSVSKVPKDKFCATADHGLVSKPFSEQWVTKKAGEDEGILEEDSEGESCSSLGTDGNIAVGSFKGHRKVYQHDGVTDFIITELADENADAETTLRLKFPGVRNPEGAFFYHTHSMVSTAKGTKVSSASIQDDLVKITILANWDTAVTSTGEGIMEVVIKNDSTSISANDGSAPRRVRVIIEETDSVFDKMTEFFPSSYGKMMTNDFIDPIGVYIRK